MPDDPELTLTFKSPFEKSLVRDALAHQHNLVRKRRSTRPSERVMECAALSAVIDRIDGKEVSE